MLTKTILFNPPKYEIVDFEDNSTTSLQEEENTKIRLKVQGIFELTRSLKQVWKSSFKYD